MTATSTTKAIAKDSKCLFSWRITKFCEHIQQSRKRQYPPSSMKIGVVSTNVFDIQYAHGIFGIPPKKKERRSLSKFLCYLLHSFGCSRAVRRFLPSLVHSALLVSVRCWFFFSHFSLSHLFVLFVIVRKSCAKSHQSLVNGGVVFVSLSLHSVSICVCSIAIIYIEYETRPTFCVFSINRNRFLYLLFFLSSLVVSFHLPILFLSCLLRSVLEIFFFLIFLCGFSFVYFFVCVVGCRVLASQCFSIVFHGSTLNRCMKSSLRSYTHGPTQAVATTNEKKFNRLKND